jgi:hypothetical protein
VGKKTYPNGESSGAAGFASAGKSLFFNYLQTWYSLAHNLHSGKA